ARELEPARRALDALDGRDEGHVVGEEVRLLVVHDEPILLHGPGEELLDAEPERRHLRPLRSLVGEGRRVAVARRPRLEVARGLERLPLSPREPLAERARIRARALAPRRDRAERLRLAAPGPARDRLAARERDGTDCARARPARARGTSPTATGAKKPGSSSSDARADASPTGRSTTVAGGTASRSRRAFSVAERASGCGWGSFSVVVAVLGV